MALKDVPIFILTKDRKSCLEAMLKRLAQDGLRNIFIVDTGSTYPPMLDFLSRVEFPIIRVTPRSHHAPKYALWDCGVIKTANQEGRFFVYTDCDTVPDKDCPGDWLGYLYRLLSKYGKKYKKAGLGLKLSDIPDRYAQKALVLKHEARYWQTTLEPHVFASELDTTLCLYTPGCPHTLSAIRTGGKYLCRHLPWYYDSRNLPDEEKHYIARLHPKASLWTRIDKNRTKL